MSEKREFHGRHYESGTIANWLSSSCHPVSEAMALGASGGIAFGYFVFEYNGHLPHVALLPRNTFSPFERALDNLGVRRTSMETVKPEKGLENLRRELDLGHAVVIWGDMFTASWNGMPQTGMWAMIPMLVIGHDDEGFWVVAGSREAFKVSVEEMQMIRGKVKKDRFRMLVLEGVDESRLVYGLKSGIETCCELFLDKPPAGSAKNFGISGMEQFVAMVRDEKNSMGWGKKFPAGDKFKQAVAGRLGQPGVWDWIEVWGTDSGADRGTYASFLRQAGPVLGVEFGSVADQFDESARIWREVAAGCLPESVPGLNRLREIKMERRALRWDDPVGSVDRRAELAVEYRQVWDECGDLAAEMGGIREAIADGVSRILAIEGAAVRELRLLVQ
ncbi:MAG: BtrH N-terminal domain-containing protein [Fimbriimonadaceae bacterium]